jgi:multisubunit Na+/H+ antiporter MnhC subunit
MVKKLVGLSIFQTSVYLLYVEPGKIIGGTPPILDPAGQFAGRDEFAPPRDQLRRSAPRGDDRHHR